METSLIIGFSAGTITTASFIPQIIKSYRTKNVNSFSTLWLLMLVIGFSLYITYGFMINAVPIILANIFSLMFILYLIKLKLCD